MIPLKGIIDNAAVNSVPISKIQGFKAPEALLVLAYKMKSAASGIFHTVSAIRCSTLRIFFKDAFHSCKEGGQWALARADFNQAGVIGIVALSLAVAGVVMICKRLKGGSAIKSNPKTSSQEINIHPNVKTTLDTLLASVERSVDKLPVYEGTTLEIGRMTAPIMKGKFDGERPFVAILVKNDVGTEHLIVLDQRNSAQNPAFTTFAPFQWFQVLRVGGGDPVFFTSNFTKYPGGAGPTVGQERGFALLQALLINGKGSDIMGINWTLVNNA